MKRLGAATLVLLPALAAAQGEPARAWLLRARALHLDPGIRDTIGLFVSVEPRTFTELDLSWLATPQLALELAVTVPQTHTVRSAGFEVGRLRQLPPTLTLQFHVPTRFGRLYLGAGASYTLVSNLRFAPQYSNTLQPSVRNHSVRPVLQLGLDVPVTAGLSLNVDVKRMQLATDLSRFGPQPGDFKVRPTLAGLGLALRF